MDVTLKLTLPEKIIRVDDGMEFLLNKETGLYRVHLGIPHLDSNDNYHHEYSFELLMLDPKNSGKFKISDGTEDVKALKKAWVEKFSKENGLPIPKERT